MNIKLLKSSLIAFVCLLTSTSLFAQKFEELAQNPAHGLEQLEYLSNQYR